MASLKDPGHDTVNINLNGIGCTVALGNVNNETWEKFEATAANFNAAIETAIFDLDFFPALANPEYSHWKDLGKDHCLSGLMDHHKSQIEIKVNNKRLARLKVEEVAGSSFLFPLYNTDLKTTSNGCQEGKNVKAIELEIGTIGNFKFTCPKFEIGDLRFTIWQAEVNPELTLTILTHIFYQDKELQPHRKDALVSGNYFYWEGRTCIYL